MTKLAWLCSDIPWIDSIRLGNRLYLQSIYVKFSSVQQPENTQFGRFLIHNEKNNRCNEEETRNKFALLERDVAKPNCAYLTQLSQKLCIMVCQFDT